MWTFFIFFWETKFAIIFFFLFFLIFFLLFLIFFFFWMNEFIILLTSIFKILIKCVVIFQPLNTALCNLIQCLMVSPIYEFIPLHVFGNKLLCSICSSIRGYLCSIFHLFIRLINLSSAFVFCLSFTCLERIFIKLFINFSLSLLQSYDIFFVLNSY